MIDRVGQTWRIIPNGNAYLFVRSWPSPQGTRHEIVSIDDGATEEWLESSNDGPLEWRDRIWERIS